MTPFVSTVYFSSESQDSKAIAAPVVKADVPTIRTEETLNDLATRLARRLQM